MPSRCDDRLGDLGAASKRFMTTTTSCCRLQRSSGASLIGVDRLKWSICERMERSGVLKLFDIPFAPGSGSGSRAIRRWLFQSFVLVRVCPTVHLSFARRPVMFTHRYRVARRAWHPWFRPAEAVRNVPAIWHLVVVRRLFERKDFVPKVSHLASASLAMLFGLNGNRMFSSAIRPDRPAPAQRYRRFRSRRPPFAPASTTTRWFHRQINQRFRPCFVRDSSAVST